MAYPCGCTPSIISDPDPCSSGTCLRVPNITVDTSDSVGPCGGIGSVDFGTNSDLTACTGSVAWQLLSYDTTAFASASIDEFGVITFTTTEAAEVGKYYTFIIKAVCSNSILSVQRNLRVPIRNLCETQVCVPNFHCNRCTGGCVADTIDLILT